MMAAQRTGLSGPEAEALVARRLAELGRDPHLVTGDAVAALRGCAESGEALRSVLTGALFLASTEDSPYVDASHVERAAAERTPAARPSPAPPAPAPPVPAPGAPPPIVRALAAPEPAAAKPRRRAPAVAALAAAVAIAAGVPSALLALRESYAPPGHVPVAPAASPSQGPKAARIAPASPPASAEPEPRASPSAPASPPAPPAPVAPAAPGPGLVRTGPALPENVRQVVLLSYGRGRPEAEARADALASALRARGISAAVVSEAGAPAAAAVSYFFADDRPLAELVGAILGGPWQLATKPLVRAYGRDLPQPGVIRVSVPAGG